ncbi:MAG: hypothetical protein RIG62_25370 [Cyclobacteriaceae bacterium]
MTLKLRNNGKTAKTIIEAYSTSESYSWNNKKYSNAAKSTTTATEEVNL